MRGKGGSKRSKVQNMERGTKMKEDGKEWVINGETDRSDGEETAKEG